MTRRRRVWLTISDHRRRIAVISGAMALVLLTGTALVINNINNENKAKKAFELAFLGGGSKNSPAVDRGVIDAAAITQLYIKQAWCKPLLEANGHTGAWLSKQVVQNLKRIPGTKNGHVNLAPPLGGEFVYRPSQKMAYDIDLSDARAILPAGPSANTAVIHSGFCVTDAHFPVIDSSGGVQPAIDQNKPLPQRVSGFDYLNNNYEVRHLGYPVHAFTDLTFEASWSITVNGKTTSSHAWWKYGLNLAWHGSKLHPYIASTDSIDGHSGVGYWYAPDYTAHPAFILERGQGTHSLAIPPGASGLGFVSRYFPVPNTKGILP